MIRNLKPYPAYRDSGVPWLGEVPEHWEVRRLKSLCSKSALYGANVPATDYTASGVRFLRTTDITDEGRLKEHGVFLPADVVRDYVLNDGDLLISRSGTIGRSFLYERKQHGPCAYAGYLVRFVPGADALPEYLLLFTKTQAFAGFLRVTAISSTIENVNGEKYANCALPLPPLPEQAAIVRFLDHAERRIRRYIRAKQKLIKLLEEQKQAIIHRAVTAQIDVRTGRPYPAYKPSGVEWLGDVPEHWVPMRLKNTARVQTGITLGKDYGTKELVKRPYLRVANVQTGKLDLSQITTIQVPLTEAEGATLRNGDVLMTEGGDIDKLGRGCVWRGEVEGCLHQNHIFAVRPDSDTLLPNFLVALMASRHRRSYFEVTAKKTTNLASTNSTTLGNFPLLLPSVQEQQRILDSIERQTSNVSSAQHRAKQEVDLLHEYRTRLIADVVTGTLDVRQHPWAQTDAPEETEDGPTTHLDDWQNDAEAAQFKDGETEEDMS